MNEYEFLLLMSIMPIGALFIGAGAVFLAWREGRGQAKLHPGE